MNTLSRFVIAFLQGVSFDFMAAVTVHSDFRSPTRQSLSLFPLFPHLFATKGWDQMWWSYFFQCWNLNQILDSPLSPSSRGFLVPLRFLPFSGVICISEVIEVSLGNLDSSLCFIQPSILHVVSAYKLNNQGDNIQPWRIRFPVLNQSVPSPVLTVASWPAYRFLRRQVRWSGIPMLTYWG